VLAHTFMALLKHDAPLLFPDITYSFYPVYCGLYGIAYREIPLTESFEISVDDYSQPNGGIIFANPNAPTGCLLPVAEIERLLKRNTDSVVVIDEAYIDFGGESCAALVKDYPQLLVVHTLSKSRALAGLRVGYALGQAPLIEALTRVKDSFNSYPLDRFAQAGATAAMEDREWLKSNRAKVIASRAQLVSALSAMGFEVLPSGANFIFARHPDFAGPDLAAQLRERNIIVRNFKQPSRIASFLRISIGMDAECDALIAALGEILRGLRKL
jgi:histidinol-phosphate aminotransferase